MTISAPLSPDRLFTTRRRSSRPSLPPDLCETDPELSAESAGLRYISDQEPGIRRESNQKGFRYLNPDGEPVTDERTLARIAAIVIPPAWTDVWISRYSNSHLQATGRDEKGRKQYRYHPRWRTVRDEAKYDRMLQFGRALPAIRRRIEEDLRRPGLSREKVIATVIQLLELTLIRIGNDEYARTNESYGLTTLLDDHVELSGSKVNFVFRGKSGKEHEIGIRDRRLAAIVKRCRDLPGQTLFQYRDADGLLHAVGSTDVNQYLREISGLDFTAKDFRTWFGTVHAAHSLQQIEPANSERERAKQVTSAVKEVADKLGNTPAICRKCYIHPFVVDAFLDGRLQETALRVRINRNGLPHQHSIDERLVLKVLNLRDESGQR